MVLQKQVIAVLHKLHTDRVTNPQAAEETVLI